MPSQPASPPRRPGVRRHEILDAALTLFSERGYHGTGMEQIAAEVGLSPSSLYNHWPSKQELLRSIMTRTMDDLLAGFATAVDGTEGAATALAAAMEAHVRYHATHHREARIGNREIASLTGDAQDLVKHRRQEYARSWRELIARGVADREFAPVAPQLAAFALLEAGIGVSQWFRPDGPLAVDEVAREYAEMALRLVGSRALT